MEPLLQPFQTEPVPAEAREFDAVAAIYIDGEPIITPKSERNADIAP